MKGRASGARSVALDGTRPALAPLAVENRAHSMAVAGVKGKPYRKGVGEGKGKYKNSGWSGSGKGKGYYGYSSKTLVGSFGETSSLTKLSKAKTVHIQLDSEIL